MNILENEIVNDPLTRGYDAMTDKQLLDSLNALNRSRNRVTMTGRQVKAAIDVTEYNALSDAKKDLLVGLTKSDDLDLFGTDKDILVDIFGAGSTTGTNLVSERVESISRGVEIGWGIVTIKSIRLHTAVRA